MQDRTLTNLVLTIGDPLQFTVSLGEHKERGTPYRESGPAAVNTIIILISDATPQFDSAAIQGS